MHLCESYVLIYICFLNLGLIGFTRNDTPTNIGTYTVETSASHSGYIHRSLQAHKLR